MTPLEAVQKNLNASVNPFDRIKDFLSWDEWDSDYHTLYEEFLMQLEEFK